MKPLSGIKVIDFTTLLPGPLATLMLCEAGAEVIKIEKIGGEDMRNSEPTLGNESVLFAMLNRGKKSIEINLKNKSDLKKIINLIKKSDVLVEQFRPGVMKRLGLDWQTVKKINKNIVYCSITGYGQHGIKKHKAGHDLNYLAESGLLKLSTSKDGTPVIPFSQIADIAGGSYPAFMNILLALFQVQKTGLGCYLDVSMYENLIPLAWLGLSKGITEKSFPKENSVHLNGGLARYNIYETKDKKFLALGALENKFWSKFCNIINAPKQISEEKISQKKIIAAIKKIIKSKNEKYWKNKFDNEEDVCCTSVNSLEDYFNDKHLIEKKIFANKIMINKKSIPLIPSALEPRLVKVSKINKAPKLGQHNDIVK